MRIAMISYHTCPLATLGGKDTGGMNVYVRDLGRDLGRRGVGVDVFTRSQDEHVPHVLHDLGYGNRIVHIPAGPETPLPRESLHDHIPQFVEGVLRFASSKGERYDLIHAHYWLSGMAAMELRQQWGLPLVQMFHTLGMMKERVSRGHQEGEVAERLKVEMQLLRNADRIVAATRAEVAQFQWLYRVDTSRVTVIPPGVDTSRFYPIPSEEAKEFIGIPPETNLVLYVGRIEALKGIDTLLEAMAELNREGFLGAQALRLAIIGGEPQASEQEMSTEMARLKALLDSLGIEGITSLLGKQDQDTLQYYYSASRVVVVPSHYESFGLVALEAMACGTPVVASETGGLAFLVHDGETGFHVPAGDAQALAERLQMVIEDELLHARLSCQATAYAKSYAWPNITEQVIDMYAEVLGTKRA